MVARRRALGAIASGVGALGLSACVGSESAPSFGAVDGGVDAGPLVDIDGIAVSDASSDGKYDQEGCEPTQADAQGPFFQGGSPTRALIARPDEPGTRLIVVGQLTQRCQTIAAGYTIDVWQADARGDYHDAGTEYRLRGNVRTDERGIFAVETIIPGRYGDANGPRPQHIHAKVYSPNGANLLTTQLYFEGDPYLGPADSCQPPTCRSGDPSRTLRLNDWTVRGTAGHYAIARLAIS